MSIELRINKYYNCTLLSERSLTWTGFDIRTEEGGQRWWRVINGYFVELNQIGGFPIPPLPIPVSTKLTNYDLVLADIDTLLYCRKTTQLDLGIPANSTVPFLIGATMNFVQGGAGQIKFIPVAPAIIISSGGADKTNGLYSLVRLTQVSIDVWCLDGDMTT